MFYNNYNPFDWYWRKSNGDVYSSKENKFIKGDDKEFEEWIKAGNIPTSYPLDEKGEESDQELANVLKPYGIIPILNIVQAKDGKIKEIDSKTNQLIVQQGFTFKKQRFSMSEAAQRNWLALSTALANNMLTYPFNISTIEDSSYALKSETELKEFLAAYMLYQADPKQPLTAGRLLKEQVHKAKTLEDLESIKDERK